MKYSCQSRSSGEGVDINQAGDNAAETRRGCLAPRTFWRPAWLSISETGSRSHRLRAQSKDCLPSPAFRCQFKSRLSPAFLTNRFQWAPSLGSVNLLEWLTKFRQMFYLVDYWFTLKEYNSVTARWMRCTQQGVRKGWATSCLLWAIHASESPLVHQLRFPNTVPVGFYGGLIT